MSLLARATGTRTKAIDQAMLASYDGLSSYVPLDNLRTWTGGPLVDPDTSLNFITVFQCVGILAETYASVPLMVYRRLEGGGRELAPETPLYRTLHDAPNPVMTSYTWRSLLMTHLATWGNAYNEIVRLGNGDIELWPIRPDRIEVKWAPNGHKDYYYLSPAGGRALLEPGRILHVMGRSTDGLIGMSPITMMRNTLRLASNGERYATAVFDNGARPAIVMKHPKTLSDPAIGRLGAQMDSLRGAGNAGKTVVLEEGLDIHEIGFPPKDAQFMESRLFQKREIAAAYRIPGGMVGDSQRAEEKEDEEARKFIKGAMVPWFSNSEQEFERQVRDDPSLYVEFLADGYLRGDPKARADAFAVQWEHGNLSNDEWRRAENLNPLPDGIGERYYRPANWVPVTEEIAPVPVGGDASSGTQFGADAALVDQMTRAKSTDVRCPSCDKLLIPDSMKVVGGSMDCYRCKARVEVTA